MSLRQHKTSWHGRHVEQNKRSLLAAQKTKRAPHRLTGRDRLLQLAQVGHTSVQHHTHTVKHTGHICLSGHETHTEGVCVWELRDVVEEWTTWAHSAHTLEWLESLFLYSGLIHWYKSNWVWDDPSISQGICDVTAYLFLLCVYTSFCALDCVESSALRPAAVCE